MKPISLKMKAFGPFLDEQFIDFSDAASRGLILICGKTGGGKTTIIDAISCSLFGCTSSGAESDGGRGDLKKMRCDLAEKEETLVEFVFEMHGKRYMFKRGLKKDRVKVNDFHNCFVYEDGEMKPILGNPTAKSVTKEAERILGIKFEQFNQVVMLPQGKFETLLVSDSTNKQAILENLFNTSYWNMIVDEMLEKAKAESDECDREILSINNTVSGYGCDHLDELTELIDRKNKEYEEDRENLKLDTEKRDKLLKIYQESKAVETQFNQLDRLIADENKLLNQEEYMTNLREDLRIANEGFEIINPYNEWVAAVKEHEKIVQDKNNQLQVIGRLKASKDELDRKIAEHENLRPAYEESKIRLLNLQNARGVYSVLAEKENEKIQFERTLMAAEKNSKSATANLEKIAANHQKILNMQAQAQTNYNTMQKKYLLGIHFEISMELEEGMPCPVCGSLSHPMPAEKTPDYVSKVMLEQAEKERDKYNEMEKSSLKNLEEAQQKKEQADYAYQDLYSKYMVINSEYNNLCTQKFADIADSKQLEAKINKLIASHRNYEESEQRILKEREESIVDLSNAEGILRTYEDQETVSKQALYKSETKLDEYIGSSPFTDKNDFLNKVKTKKEIDAMTTRLAEYDTALKNATVAREEQSRLLQGVVRPNMSDIDGEYRYYANICSDADKNLAILGSYIEKLQKDISKLTSRKKAYDIRQAKADANMAFVKKLRGDNGIGLQRFVLSTMLDSITVEANNLLVLAHGGRYILNRSSESGKSVRKKGLNLEVYDNRDGVSRSVSSLSGGEKFLVALCLGIGLNSVVQRSGSIRLESMFIDEGFGTLDQESIDDALKILDNIQKNDCTVAIISHQEKVVNTIQNKIEVVEKTVNGVKSSMIKSNNC